MTKEERKEYNREYRGRNKEKMKIWVDNNRGKLKEQRKKRYHNQKKEKSGLYKIYKLTHNDQVIYVGITTLSLIRRKGLTNTSVPKNIYKESRIELIEETREKGRERYWIDHYLSLGLPLMNKRGGDYSSKEESYEAIKAKYRSKSNFKPKTEEEKKLIRKKYYQENREKILKNIKEKYHRGEEDHKIII